MGLIKSYQGRKFIRLSRFLFQYQDYSKGIPYQVYKNMIRRENINADSLSKKFVNFHLKRVETQERNINLSKQADINTDDKVSFLDLPVLVTGKHVQKDYWKAHSDEGISNS